MIQGIHVQLLPMYLGRRNETQQAKDERIQPGRYEFAVISTLNPVNAANGNLQAITPSK